MQYSSLAALALLGLTAAADSPPSCGSGKSACPSEYPCCSTDGTCGNGYVCLGGCDARYSYTAGSCVAMPIYNSSETKFNGTEGVATYADYLGDAQKNAWSYLGNITNGDDNSLRVQMYKNSTGSTVYSSYYLWYGKVTVNMKTSGGAGVISDFILLSNVKDEVDYEFVGYNTSAAQTNYYWQGLQDYHNMIGADVSSDTENNYHEYVIDWQEDKVEWSIDGTVVRTLTKAETLNSSTGVYKYPQTPARIEFGLWPGGDSDAQGTSEWAGGKIDWNSGQGANPGYFFVDVSSISVQAYDPPSGVNRTGSKSYIYTSKEAQEKDVAITNDDYILKSTDGTGDDLDGPYGHSSSVASSSAASSSSVRSSSASSSLASSSSASSSSAVSSSASSSSVRSSSANSSSSLASSSRAPSSSIDSSSSAAPSSTSDQTSGTGNNNAASGGASTSSRSSSSSSSSSSAKATNGAGRMAIPMLAGIIPAFMI